MPYSTQSPHEHGRHPYSLGQLPSFNRELLRSLLCLTFSPLSVAGSKFSISYNQLFLMEMLVTEDEGGTEAVWTVYVVPHPQKRARPSSGDAVCNAHPCPWWLLLSWECWCCNGWGSSAARPHSADSASAGNRE